MAAPLELNLHPDARTLRQFGWIALGAFALLGGLVVWRGGLFGFDFGDATWTVAGSLWALGVLSGAFSLAAPRANLPLWIALTLAAFPIGYAVSLTLLGFLFFGVLTPVSLAFRLIGRDALRRRFDPAAKSYWIERSGDAPLERYFRQF